MAVEGAGTQQQKDPDTVETRELEGGINSELLVFTLQLCALSQLLDVSQP